MTVQVSVTGNRQAVQVDDTPDGAIGKIEVEKSSGAEVMLNGSAVRGLELLQVVHSPVCGRNSCGSLVEEGDDCLEAPFDVDIDVDNVPTFEAPATTLPTILFAALTIPPTTPVAWLIAFAASASAVGTSVAPPLNTEDAMLGMGTIVAVRPEACA